MPVTPIHGTANGYRYHGCRCVDCRAAHAEKCYAFRRANPDKVRRYTANYSKRRHGISPEDYDAMLASQGGGCAICGATEAGGQGVFHIDHDHACCPGARSCGACVRGLLCAACNFSLGAFKDDPAVLQKAIDYLNSRKAMA